jgi:hypothetical protein
MRRANKQGSSLIETHHDESASLVLSCILAINENIDNYVAANAKMTNARERGKPHYKVLLKRLQKRCRKP